MINLNILSEIETLKAVLIHTPGPEVENMSPSAAERALYSDILNLSVAAQEYQLFKAILSKLTAVYEVTDLLLEILKNSAARKQISEALVTFCANPVVGSYIESLDDHDLAIRIIEGIPFHQKTLTNFLNREMYAISPLHNIFFTRDAAFTIGNTVFISSMARQVREPETMVMQAIFEYFKGFKAKIISLAEGNVSGKGALTIEGGDIIVAAKGVLVLGIGSRTNAQGVDYLIKKILEYEDISCVIIQELPDKPESFIHLDMVFTLLNYNECMVYEPLLFGKNRYHTIVMKIEKRKIIKIEYADNIIVALKTAGIDLKPLICGGRSSKFQEREQWHSGANFFAIAPGKLIGYDRNVHTANELNQHGYQIIGANEFVSTNPSFRPNDKVLITIPGSELARGGGGARCMTMPLLRE